VAQLDLTTVEGSHGANGKRKADDASAADEDHAEFDPASLREHEEFTKVKNINRIEIGKFDVETWCVTRQFNTGASIRA
jgi:histone acetyltransferase MYST1